MLQVGPPAETERADAVRNRARILDAARTILDASGVDALTMDAVAREAGLGKGTVFRRFGSRSQLLLTLLNSTEEEFQRGFLAGPPPLGPGANPVDRLIAFGRARLDLLGVQGDLLRAAEASAESRYSSPARAASVLHITMLLRSGGVQGDVPVLATTLNSTLDAALVLHENRVGSVSMERIANGWEDLVRRVTAPQQT
ncbi:TetR family transcriptional regulator [Glaciihabitans tibetensis]|uniref:TetR family transcriptional regulator n=2 Tax=Glaciihabitans tibetensis TaxID=1266600 RepID=A0A2T0V2H7_9MICO|nr:TetR family transcriptional regulator [Glaciihabitans tibetensis]